MKNILHISEQTLVRDIDGDTDAYPLVMEDLNYSSVPVPEWPHGLPCHEKLTGDIVYYIGPTRDWKRAVVRNSGGRSVSYSEFDWDQLEAIEEVMS